MSKRLNPLRVLLRSRGALNLSINDRSGTSLTLYQSSRRGVAPPVEIASDRAVVESDS